jgi:hypothetical protein
MKCISFRYTLMHVTSDDIVRGTALIICQLSKFNVPLVLRCKALRGGVIILSPQKILFLNGNLVGRGLCPAL